MGIRVGSQRRAAGGGSDARIAIENPCDSTRQKTAGRLPPSRRWLRGIGALMLVVAVTNSVSAGPLSLPNRDRREAKSRIPFSKLTPDAQRKIRAVIDRPTLYRKMPTNQINCDADLYQFMVRYPEVVVNIWQLMGITKVSANRTGPYHLEASDGVGTVTKVELVYGDQNTHLIYCDGYYEGPMFRRPIKGRCVLVLRSEFGNAANGSAAVTNSMDVFLQFDNMAVDVVTRTLHPLVGKAADMNFVQSTQFLERVWRTTEENGPGMTRLAERLDQVQPDVRRQFAKLTESVFQVAQQQKRANASAAVR